MIANSKISWKKRFLMPVVAVAASVVMFVSIGFTANAESQGKITAGGSVNVRASASTNSEAIASAESGSTIRILSQTTGEDGYVWYEIYVSATTTGWVRSDLATITDGTTPDGAGSGNTDSGITMVNPVSGSVNSETAVRVRSDASTSGTIIASASNSVALTINGTKEGTDGRIWYYVSFTDNGASYTGFIRSDFVTVNGDLTPIDGSAPSEEPAPAPGPSEPTDSDTGSGNVSPSEPTNKAYDTMQDGEEWYLLDYGKDVQYKISDILSLNDSLKKEHKKAVALRVWMIIFIILTILSVGGAAYLFMKLRDIGDKAAFADAEKERRARIAGNQKPGRPSQGQSGRPAGSAPTGTRPAQGQPSRPAGSAPAGTRPAQGQPSRPAGSAPAGTRPAGAPSGTRPAGTRPVQGAARPGQGPATRPVQTQSPSGSQERPTRPAAPSTRPQGAVRPDDDDDEFEFGFLNWDSKDSE